MPQHAITTKYVEIAIDCEFSTLQSEKVPVERQDGTSKNTNHDLSATFRDLYTFQNITQSVQRRCVFTPVQLYLWHFHIFLTGVNTVLLLATK